MTLTVLMSIYSKEKPEYFQQSMESIWDQQTIKPHEIILIEDGELTAQLYIIIENWEKKLKGVLRRLRINQNSGLAIALNYGIEYCTGEFIARMDTDDISAPDRFKKQIQYLQAHKNIDLVGGCIKEFSCNNNNLFIRRYPTTHNSIFNSIAKASPFAHPTVMFRKKIFDNGVRYSNKYKTSQDIDLWFRMIKLGYKFANLSDIIYHLRITPEFYKRRSRAKALNEFKIYVGGIISIHGFSWKLMYPFIRLFIRFLPAFLLKYIYYSPIRKSLNVGTVNAHDTVPPGGW